LDAANISIDSALGSQPISTKEEFGDSDSDEALGISKITSIPFMRSSALIPNLSSDCISLSIAELYGPLPTESDILNKITPILRPHMNKKINFSLKKLVERILNECDDMCDRQASDRASRIVDRAWAEVVAEEQRLGNERRRLRVLAESERRLVGRRVRKITEDESVETQEGEGARGAGRGQKHLRTDIVLN